MFSNIGKKIKILAIVICWIGIIVDIIFGIALICTDEELIAPGILAMTVGPFLSWISCFFIYGFGELIERTTSIDEKLGKGNIEQQDDSDLESEISETENTISDSNNNRIKPNVTSTLKIKGVDTTCSICNKTKTCRKYFMKDENGKSIQENYICYNCAADMGFISIDKEKYEFHYFCPKCEKEINNNQEVCSCGQVFDW